MAAAAIRLPPDSPLFQKNYIMAALKEGKGRLHTRRSASDNYDLLFSSCAGHLSVNKLHLSAELGIDGAGKGFCIRDTFAAIIAAGTRPDFLGFVESILSRHLRICHQAAGKQAEVRPALGNNFSALVRLSMPPATLILHFNIFFSSAA